MIWINSILKDNLMLLIFMCTWHCVCFVLYCFFYQIILQQRTYLCDMHSADGQARKKLEYRVPHFKPYNSRSLFFHLLNNFLMFKIRFHILQIWTFYDISSFFDLLLHKLVFFKKKFFFPIFFKKMKKNFRKFFIWNAYFN